MLKKHTVILSFLAAPIFSQATEVPLSLGLGAFWAQSPYKGGDNRTYPLPLVNYQTDQFFIHGLEAGYYLWAGQQDQFSIIATSSFQQFKPSKTDDQQLKQLDKRRITLMMGGEWTHIAQWGVFKTALTGDVLNESNGLMWDTNWHYPLQYGQLSLLPGLGVTWQSAHQTDYYYGVSANEAQRSGLDSYDADDSWTPYVDITATYSIDSQWSVMAGGRYAKLTSKIKNSPMVDASSEAMLWTGINYRF